MSDVLQCCGKSAEAWMVSTAFNWRPVTRCGNNTVNVVTILSRVRPAGDPLTKINVETC